MSSLGRGDRRWPRRKHIFFPFFLRFRQGHVSKNHSHLSSPPGGGILIDWFSKVNDPKKWKVTCRKAIVWPVHCVRMRLGARPATFSQPPPLQHWGAVKQTRRGKCSLNLWHTLHGLKFFLGGRQVDIRMMFYLPLSNSHLHPGNAPPSRPPPSWWDHRAASTPPAAGPHNRHGARGGGEGRRRPEGAHAPPAFFNAGPREYGGGAGGGGYLPSSGGMPVALDLTKCWRGWGWATSSIFVVGRQGGWACSGFFWLIGSHFFPSQNPPQI